MEYDNMGYNNDEMNLVKDQNSLLDETAPSPSGKLDKCEPPTLSPCNPALVAATGVTENPLLLHSSGTPPPPNEMAPEPVGDLDECGPAFVRPSTLPPGTPVLVAATGVTENPPLLYSSGTPPLPNEMAPEPVGNLDKCGPVFVRPSTLPPGTPVLVAATGVTEDPLPLHSVGTPPPQSNESPLDAGPSLGVSVGAVPKSGPPPSTRPVVDATLSILSRHTVDGQETEPMKDGTARLALDTPDTGAGAPESDAERNDGFDAFPSASPTLPTLPSVHPVTTIAHSISSQHMAEETKLTKDGLDIRDTGAPESETELKDRFDTFPSTAPTLPVPLSPSTHLEITTAHSVSSLNTVDDHQMAERTKDGVTQLALATQTTVCSDASDTGCGTPGLLVGAVVTLAPISPTHPVTTTTPRVSSQHVVDPRATVGLANTDPGILEREAPALPPLPSTCSAKTSLVFSDWPNHVVDIHRYLTEETVVTKDGAITKARNWGDRWLSCLEFFFEFQRQAGFPTSGPSFPPFTNIRPSEIAIWMKNGRQWQDADIIDLDRFGRQWWAWWHSLQPKSRICDEGDPQLPTSKMDWSDLRKPGKNGFLLIIISLVWWGKTSGQDEHWMKAISDVTAVLLCLNSISGHIADKPKVKISSAANAAGSIRPKRSRRGEVVVGEPSKKIRKKQS